MKNILLRSFDGPEGIEIYTDDDRGVIDWAQSFPALYVTVCINGASAQFGPFQLGSTYESLKRQILGSAEVDSVPAGDDDDELPF